VFIRAQTPEKLYNSEYFRQTVPETLYKQYSPQHKYSRREILPKYDNIMMPIYTFNVISEHNHTEDGF
jgi:hypothetical protein